MRLVPGSKHHMYLFDSRLIALVVFTDASLLPVHHAHDTNLYVVESP